MSKHTVTGKIIIAATFKTVTPFVIGKGKTLSEAADCDVMTNFDGKPYIPASGFAGKLKAFIQSRLPTEKGGLSAYFWGTEYAPTDKQEYQSHIIIEDLLTFDEYAEKKISIRDGVKINYKTGIAEAGAKYDYQVAEPELLFHLKAEITQREGSNFNEIAASINEVHVALKHRDFRIGALTNHGLGVINVIGFKAWHFDFKEKKNTADWFNYLTSIQQIKKINKAYFEVMPTGLSPLVTDITGVLNDGAFRIVASFNLKNSIIIGTDGTAATDEDKKHLQSNGKNILTGKSIRGALRNRAEKIKNVLNLDAKILNVLFGEVDKTNNIKVKGKLRIEELIVEGSKSFTQNRIKIDRFTGGTMSGALFNSAPVTSDDAVQLQFTILKDATANEKGLLLLLLKDLWTEDLAIGGEKNIGRGILTGLNATITDNNGAETIINKDGVSKENTSSLNQYVSSLKP
jgi:CRISPR/Cas system CSM-associated protein Csm3 (group 7 of RAMP superfamily)